MDTHPINPPAPTQIGTDSLAPPTPTKTALWPFAAAIFLGAFLLFQVQPIIGRYILPWFGGAPGVWTACMLFFQVLLLAGYAYAHFSIQRLSPRLQALTHLALLALCLILLNITPDASWKPHSATAIANPTWRIIALLAAHVGLPFFALSATGPLLQAWISRINGGQAPYRLYALSNLGSLLALLSYPFVFEPLLGRAAQAGAWSWGMRAFVIACAACALLAWRNKAPMLDQNTSASSGRVPPSPLSRWLLWFLLPASASMLLLATTNKICQDIAVVPFLWILPLALYLLSFVLTFDSPRWYWRRTYMLLLAIGLLVLFLFAWKPDDIDNLLTKMKATKMLLLVVQVALYAGILFVACMIFHGELVRLKPTPRHLTSFYLMIAAGGAAGGAFVAVVAPLIFSDFHELYIAMLLCAAFFPVTLYLDKSSPFHRGRLRFVWHTLAGLLLALALALQWYSLRPSSQSLVVRYRSFYGVLSIFEYDPDDPMTHRFVLQHGIITHGLQFVDSARRLRPTTYYERGTGVGLAITDLTDEGPRHIGVVGLGTGTIAAYGHDSDRIRFYEINPQVDRIAHQHFSYLADCPGKVSVVMGDARLSMETEPPQAFDVLVLDAFSGDAIPVHLLTREAFQVYLPHMKDRGVIAVHVSNHYLDLEPIVARLAEHFGLQARLVNYYPGDGPLDFSSDWILVYRDPDMLKQQEADDPDIQPAKIKNAPLWTDDHTSLLPILR